jgi:hypothetical protein
MTVIWLHELHERFWNLLVIIHWPASCFWRAGSNHRAESSYVSDNEINGRVSSASSILGHWRQPRALGNSVPFRYICIYTQGESCRKTVGMNSTYQTRKQIQRNRSANTFFLSYSMANLVTVSSDILNWVISFLKGSKSLHILLLLFIYCNWVCTWWQ